MNFRTTGLAVACVVGLLCVPTGAVATVITYDLVHLGGARYQYNYTVTNDGTLTSSLELFDIDFDTGLYDETTLSITSSAEASDAWDQILLSSGIGVPAAFDALSLNGGLGLLESFIGFSVAFDWLGAGTPGQQTFSVFDAQDFSLLGTGVTRSSSVPEPGGLGLLACALAGAWFSRRRRRTL